MATTRRGFLTAALGAAASLPLLPRFAFARAALAGARRDRLLVLVDLAGGNDGLNMVVPFADPLYQKARTALRIGRDGVLPLADGIGLRRELAPLHTRFEAGELAIVQGVGYPGPDRSHFRSTDIWHTASLAPVAPTTGWIARLGERSDLALPGRIPLVVTAGGNVPLACVGARGPAPQFERVEELDVAMGPGAGGDARARELAALAEGADGSATLRLLRETARATHRQMAQMEQAVAASRVSGDYPKAPVGAALRLAAQLLSGGLELSACYVRQEGYDTHAYQADLHALLLRDLGAALGAFWNDIVAAGAADRVVVMVWSEFGRRVQENGSKGTDHGAAAPVLLLGQSLRGGLHGAAPRLDALDDGDLRFTTDFRSVYATLLDDWFEAPSTELLGAPFAKLPLIRRSA